MKKTIMELISLMLVLLTTIGVIAATVVYDNSTKPSYEILARAPENGNWYPQTITVKRGEKVTLSIRNVDAVSHGFLMPEFGIAVREIKGGEVETVELLPEEKGEFPFYCSVWCSDYHMQMRGKLIVE